MLHSIGRWKAKSAKFLIIGDIKYIDYGKMGGWGKWEISQAIVCFQAKGWRKRGQKLSSIKLLFQFKSSFQRWTISFNVYSPWTITIAKVTGVHWNGLWPCFNWPSEKRFNWPHPLPPSRTRRKAHIKRAGGTASCWMKGQIRCYSGARSSSFSKQRYMRYHKIFIKTISPKRPSKTQKQVSNQNYRPFAAQTPLTKEVVERGCAVVSATPYVAYCWK